MRKERIKVEIIISFDFPVSSAKAPQKGEARKVMKGVMAPRKPMVWSERPR